MTKEKDQQSTID